MILDKIVAAAKKRVEQAKLCQKDGGVDAKRVNTSFPLTRSTQPLAFEKALSKNGLNFICEVKKASPSKGVISQDFKYRETALSYEDAGAAAISVLTEPDFFLGKNEYLTEIKKEAKIPVLRKDFIIDEFQIYEAKSIGADAILLICAILSFDDLKKFMSIAERVCLSCLVEIHNEKEAESALKAGAKIIGVNNRDLRTFQVDLQNSVRLRKLIPEDKIFVSESGIKTKEDIVLLKANKVNAVLIGEELMRSGDIKEKLRQLNG
ncbi:MAG: indole-3-glycerol phosphate synthase TrpC [Endomicrobium sp.]|jgi:indole-3-glycerol phosphate synthase|nr:indole-3-glycerol phosphate synthase TrpC [Endomicrobium sp.]